ncbi:hypothetical protein M427DRAFT_45738 [Gonapodya prolifera JEL478]|uniref:SBNO alpha/beta domain-containing protein n=1 Tax=Gonapodya prolifera (strain JEL478) TaxID=1344416 RepID=A0A139A9S7_GONPJ|nr:hypothetical protein M427DRAFT_45738 [Gonapodya prolifera JEL478]|eukprot:KXS13429.1 hypothetical protein M427DRAFT_45738 [Gonapodya prolifera JEL478]
MTVTSILVSIKTQHWALKVDRGLTSEDATNFHEEWKNDHPRNGWPHLGEVLSLNYWSDLLRGHARVPDAQVATNVKKLWDRQYESRVTLCTHAMMSLNGRCKNAAARLGCTVVWTKVEDALLQAGCTERIKIVRATVTVMDRRIIVKFDSHVLAALAKAQMTGGSD